MQEQRINSFKTKLSDYERLLGIFLKEARGAGSERIEALKEAEQNLMREISSFQKVYAADIDNLPAEDREDLASLYARITARLAEVKTILKSEIDLTGKELAGLRKMRAGMGQSARTGSSGGSPNSAVYIDILS